MGQIIFGSMIGFILGLIIVAAFFIAVEEGPKEWIKFKAKREAKRQEKNNLHVKLNEDAQFQLALVDKAMGIDDAETRIKAIKAVRTGENLEVISQYIDKLLKQQTLAPQEG